MKDEIVNRFRGRRPEKAGVEMLTTKSFIANNIYALQKTCFSEITTLPIQLEPPEATARHQTPRRLPRSRPLAGPCFEARGAPLCPDRRSQCLCRPAAEFLRQWGADLPGRPEMLRLCTELKQRKLKCN
ncbi:hypothetical protein GN956_G9355 [Arapaima gigas]